MTKMLVGLVPLSNDRTFYIAKIMTSKFAQIIFGQNFQIWQTLGDKVCFVLAAPIWAAKYGAKTLGMMTLCLTTLSKTV
jgi:hypothetical protein